MVCVLITRPKHTGQALAHELEALGYETLQNPILNIRPEAFDAPDLSRYGGLIFTSAHAIRIFADHCPDKSIPVYCVGDQSATIARDHGFIDICSASGTVLNLQQLLIDMHKDKSLPLLYVRGVDIKQELVEMADLKIEELVVYKADVVEEITDEVAHALDNETIDVALFFSKRSAAVFINTALQNGFEQQLQRIKALCISESVLEYVRNLNWAQAHASTAPNRASMIETLQDLCAVPQAE